MQTLKTWCICVYWWKDIHELTVEKKRLRTTVKKGILTKAYNSYIGLPRWLSGKEFASQCRSQRRHKFDPWVRKIPWRRTWKPTPAFLLGELHGQRTLTDYKPWLCKEPDTTEHTWWCFINGGHIQRTVLH